jgi:hypothetical protein
MSVTESLVEAAVLVGEMAWDTWWALVLGLTLSGAIEAFVGDETVSRALGDDGWREVALAGLFGAASSSCSYSAVGTAKTLFKKGASGVASLGAFMFASTDLVLELGLVIWVLLGWQFVVGEYLGGVVAVVVIAAVLKYAVPDAWFDAARDHVRAVDGAACPACGMAVDPGADDVVSTEVEGRRLDFCCGGCLRVHRARTTDGGASLGRRLRSRDGWVSAANAAVKDWEMIWDDVVLGFVLAGLVGAFVPASVWEGLFGAGTTPSAVVTTAVVAAMVGAVTFMCSVGNVPFALVLWRNGLSYGGVLTFVYADLLIPPLVNLYRKYYGVRLATAITVALFLGAVVAGVVVGYVVGGLGVVPDPGTTGGVVGDEYTTVLNAVFTPVFLGQLYVAWGPKELERRLRRALLGGVRVLQGCVVAVDVGFLALWAAVVAVAPALRATVAVGPTTRRALVAVADEELPPRLATVAVATALVAAGREWRRALATGGLLVGAAATVGWRAAHATAGAVVRTVTGTEAARRRPLREESRRMLAAGLRGLDRLVGRLRNRREGDR